MATTLGHLDPLGARRPWPSRVSRSSLAGMSGTVVTRPPARGADADEALAARAAAGDGAAFAALYRRYEQRAFNLCYRITGSHEDAADATQEAFLGVLRRLPHLEGRGVVFGSYLFTSARNACYDLIERRKRAEPTDELPEGAPPEPRDPSEDPDRNVLLAAQQEEIREANEALPERQREALALRELEDLSYDEIAEIMGMNRNSVAQLISRARINLRDALRGTAMQSIAPSSGVCTRVLPLLAMVQDDQLGEGSADAGWLDEHLSGCTTCRLSREAMQEAGASYRAWIPVAAAPWLFRETMAKAAELVGADWTETIEARAPRHPLRRLLIAAPLAAVLLLAAFATGLRDDAPPPSPTLPVAEEAPPAKAKASKPARRDRDKPSGGGNAVEQPSAEPGVAAAEDVVVPTGAEAQGRGQAFERPRQRRSREAVTEVIPTTPEPPPPTEPPPAEPPPPEPPPEDPPTSDPPTGDPPTVCRDASGQPIRCPPRP